MSHKRSLFTKATQECAWVRRKTQGQPTTKGISQKKNLPHVENALTRQETQEPRSPSHEEIKFCN